MSSRAEEFLKKSWDLKNPKDTLHDIQGSRIIEVMESFAEELLKEQQEKLVSVESLAKMYSQQLKEQQEKIELLEKENLDLNSKITNWANAGCFNKEDIICPECGTKHIDEGEWASKLHKKHLCEECGNIWEPYPYQTFGI